MVKQYKVDAVNKIVDILKDKKNIILTNYSGTKVADITQLRTELKGKGASYQVVKNNLFRRALKDAGYIVIDEHLKGPIAVTFAGEEIGDAAKALKNFKKDHENFDYFLGVVEGVLYTEDQIKQFADLPTREVLLSQTLSLVQGPATGIAMGMNQIMSSLARAIQAVAEKNGQ
jgi:large subunit ribosomal protein L10